MTFHARLVSPTGQVYQCEHNHRTETAAITCAGTSATRRMAYLAWSRAAVQAAQAAARAQRLQEERIAAQERRLAAQADLARRREQERVAAEARKVAAQNADAARKASAARAKADKRAAKLAAMPSERAWKRMTPQERLVKTAESEMQVYGTIVSPEAKVAYDKHAAQLFPSPAQNSQPRTPAEPTVRPATPSQSTTEPWWKQPGLRA